MAYDFSKLAKPLSPDEPCGPDLDVAGDPDFANFVARAEGIFPTTFLTRDADGKLQTFDRTTIEFPAEFKVLDRLLETTRDLRLLTIYGRLLALNRDLAGFAGCVSGIATLLRDFWDDVPPKGDEGDYSLRNAVLQALDDNPTIIQPLHYIPLVDTRRSGPVTYRSVLIASGEAKAREGEQSLDRAALDRAVEEAELDDLKATSARLHALIDAVALIQATTVEKAGFDQAVMLDKLPPLVQKMAEFVDAGVASRDPTSAQAAAQAGAGAAGTEPGEDGQAARSTTPAGTVRDVASASQALSAVLTYFQSREPSNPAVLLVQQAKNLMGKSFPEVVKILIPSEAEKAKIQIGADKMFGLTFEQFATAAAAAAAANGDAPGADDGAPDDGGDGATPPAAPAITARSRSDAASLLDQVSAFYRGAEPSSPIPLFTERARSMIERDFLAILKEVLPALAPKT